MANLLQKVLVSTTVGTVIGLSTILGAMNSVAALTVQSESKNNKGVIQDISHIAFYIKDNSGKVTKVKIDGVSGTTSYDATNFLKTFYPDSEVVAYQVKASTNKSFVSLSTGYSEANLPNTDRNSSDVTYQYSIVSNLPDPKPQQLAPAQDEDSTVINQQSNTTQVEETTLSEEQSNTIQVEDTNLTKEQEATSSEPEPQLVVTVPTIQTNSSIEAVSVPEPASIAAIVIFGLSGLVAKKKASS